MQTDFVFKFQICAFFEGHLTPAGYKMDPEKVQAISEMKPPENLQDLQSFVGLVNYLNRFSPALADFTAPLRAHCKKDTEEEGLAARDHRPSAAFLSPRSQFFTIRTDLRPANNMFIFSCSKLVLQPITNGFVYAT